LHYYDGNGKQSRATNVIKDNIMAGADKLPHGTTTVHMGWLYQDDYSLRELAKVGVEIDYSPAPGLKQDGDNDFNDWSDFSYRPQIKYGIKMIPAYTYKDWLLSKKTGTERVLQHITTVPIIYKRLLNSFFNTGMDFFVTYFHADELIPALGDWRDKMYSIEFLKANIDQLKNMAVKRGYEPKFVTIRELAGVLF